MDIFLNYSNLYNLFLENLEPVVNTESLCDFFSLEPNSDVNKEMLKELRDYLDELDRRRKQNWRSIYPWMDEIFIKELGNK